MQCAVFEAEIRLAIPGIGSRGRQFCEFHWNCTVGK